MSIHQPFKKLVFMAIASFAIVCTAATFIEKATFSGYWKLNQQKSELGNSRYSVTKTLKVQEKEITMFVRRVISTFRDDRPIDEELTLGKENENVGFDKFIGNFKKKSTVKWSDDGKSLIINSVIQFGEKPSQRMELKATETWTVINNGQSLMIETIAVAPWGADTTKAVYDKAE